MSEAAVPAGNSSDRVNNPSGDHDSGVVMEG